MVAQQKLLRVFRLIRILSQPPGRTIDELAAALEITRRSVYRYLDLLEAIGYLVDKDLNGRYFLFTPVKDDQPRQFTPEESDMLRQLIQGGANNNVIRDSLLRKLYLNTDLLPMADQLHNAHAARIVQLLSEAIQDRVRARLIGYYSPRKGTTSDRIVEPLHLTDNFKMLAAYELEAKQIKHYKIDRIQDIELLGESQTHEKVAGGTDFFGMSGESSLEVELGLSPLAYRLLVEEFPTTRPLVTASDFGLPYRFKGEIRGFEGIGRFIMGLPGEIEILTPTSLIEYVEGRLEQRRWRR